MCLALPYLSIDVGFFDEGTTTNRIAQIKKTISFLPM
jgi:hypothetical protein